MFSLPGIVGLVLFVFVRPQEVFVALQAYPLIHIFTLLAVFGLAIDLRLRLVTPQPGPQLVWALSFFAWCLFTAAIKSESLLSGVGGEDLTVIDLAILAAWYYLTSHGVQTFRSLKALSAIAVMLAVFLSIVSIHQAQTPFQCIEIEEDMVLTVAAGVPDGRPCKKRQDCFINGAKPGGNYICERTGMMQTSTIGGRTRYRGVLQDPNELSLALSCALPFVFLFYQLRRNLQRLLILIGLTLVTVLAVYYTKSRGGQLVLLAVLGVYLIYRFGWNAVIAGGLVLLPAVIFLVGGGGRSDADASTTERLRCFWEGMEMFRANPVIGVGFGQFTVHHYLTAHNSYILAPAELGLPGTFLWLGALYVSVKIPWRGLKHNRPTTPDRYMAHYFALALLSSMIGLVLGVLFLSFNYHYLLWWYVGLTGAYYQAVKRHDKTFVVDFGAGDFFLLIGITIGVVGAMYTLTRLFPPL